MPWSSSIKEAFSTYCAARAKGSSARLKGNPKGFSFHYYPFASSTSFHSLSLSLLVPLAMSRMLYLVPLFLVTPCDSPSLSLSAYLPIYSSWRSIVCLHRWNTEIVYALATLCYKKNTFSIRVQAIFSLPAYKTDV